MATNNEIHEFTIRWFEKYRDRIFWILYSFTASVKFSIPQYT